MKIGLGIFTLIFLISNSCYPSQEKLHIATTILARAIKERYPDISLKPALNISPDQEEALQEIELSALKTCLKKVTSASRKFSINTEDLRPCLPHTTLLRGILPYLDVPTEILDIAVKEQRLPTVKLLTQFRACKIRSTHEQKELAKLAISHQKIWQRLRLKRYILDQILSADLLQKAAQYKHKKRISSTPPIHDIINTIKKRALSQSADTDCSICREDIDPSKILYLICGHYFHKNCIKEWEGACKKNKQEHRCPFCRGPMIYLRSTSLAQ